ncbi:hypothetical protein DE146DRAFT_307283 [Phaeosphaeria sp. MPI-PUGE-AT-0046c]|nr:hypothetical protein DE146DRAFT_307283 [Phaeosphaeria sp. MPI-PUGE-AT-0046c]
MSAHESTSSGTAWPSTPGLHLSRSAGPVDQPDVYDTKPYSSTRLASLDLTTTRDPYGTDNTWTELHEFPSTKHGDSDTQKLLDSRVRRSSTASTTSTASTVVRQSRPVRWLTTIGNVIETFFNLPGIRALVWPFRWLDDAMRGLVAKTRFQGWRMGILLACCTSSLVLGANIAILVIGATRSPGFENGFAVPMSGQADDMSWWSSAIHIAVNALSTILLAASNYTMQVLSSPTRKDIDKAHAKHQHLDIGVLSMRNLGRIPRRRLMLFMLMGLSSIPVHLFYNSAVFYIGANNEYDLHVVQLGSDEYNDIFDKSQGAGRDYDLIDGSKWTRIYDTNLVSYGTLYIPVTEFRSEINNDTLTGRPENWPEVNTQIADEWNKGNVTWSLNAPLIHELSQTDFVRSITRTDSTSKSWIRMDIAYDQSARDKPSNNPPKFANVPHVFAKRLDTASRIQLSLTFLIIVIVCNSVKLLTMIWVVFMERKDYIVTLGDGAASFLERPDPTTERMCILSKEEIVREVGDMPHRSKHNDQLSRLVGRSGKTWEPKYTTYSNALNRDREIGSYFIFIVIGVLFALLVMSLVYMGKASTKWGTKSDTTFREADSSAQQTLLNAWIANAGQIVLSFCYLAINSECTAMAGAAEWNSLATSRKGLRVTRPVGQQRDTYFLQLPYRWSLPLTISSGGLHWLLSQSVFLVRIDTYDRAGVLVKDKEKKLSRSACGFSGASWIVLTVCFFILVGTVGLVGRKKIRTKIPFAASCSLVISAACHTPMDDADAHLLPLRWGEVKTRMYDGELHCSLSSRSVTKPKAGEHYL